MKNTILITILMLFAINSQAADFQSWTYGEELYMGTSCQRVKGKLDLEHETELTFTVIYTFRNAEMVCYIGSDEIQSLEVTKSSVREFFAPTMENSFGKTKAELIATHGEPEDQDSSSIEFYDDRNEVYITFELRNNKAHKIIIEF